MSILFLYIIFITLLLTSNNFFFQVLYIVSNNPNASIAYIILLTIPVTVASTKRSFSKLIIKILLAINYVTRKIK
jgi:hypothetical protein